MSISLGTKINARLKEIEARIDAMLEGICMSGANVPYLTARVDAVLEEICTTDINVQYLTGQVKALEEKVKALEAKRGPGRPKNVG